MSGWSGITNIFCAEEDVAFSSEGTENIPSKSSETLGLFEGLDRSEAYFDSLACNETLDDTWTPWDPVEAEDDETVELDVRIALAKQNGRENARR